MKPFKCQGQWYLPENPNTRVAGTLQYTVANGLRLSLLGTLQSNRTTLGASQEYATIHGLAQTPYGKRATLFKSLQTSVSISSPGFSTEELLVQLGVFGDLFVEGLDTKFDKAYARLVNQYAWFGATTFVWTPQPDGHPGPPFQVSAAYPEQFNAKLGRATVELAPRVQASLKQWNVASLKQGDELSITNFGAKSLQSILSDLVSPLQQFLTIVTGEVSRVISFRVAGDDFKILDDHEASLNVVYQPTASRNRLRKRRRYPHEWLVNPHDESLNIDREQMLREWFKFYDVRREFCNVWFSHRVSPASFVEPRFMAAVQALALYFAGEQDIAGQVTQEIASLSDELAVQSVVRQRLLFLRGLKASILKLRPAVEMVIADPDSFLEHVSRILAALDDRDTLRDGSAIHWTSEKLYVVLDMLVLAQLNLSVEQIQTIVGNNASVAYLRSK